MSTVDGQAEQEIMQASNMHCGGKCLLKVHVKDGVLTRIETYEGEDPQFRPCLRCRAYRQMLYSKERLLYPLKRVGNRGDGKFERVTWDVALDIVAGELKRVRETYGPAARVSLWGAGDSSRFNNVPFFQSLLAKDGGHTTCWGAASYEGGVYASLASYGDFSTWSSRDGLIDSKLIILWALNPAVTIQDTGTTWHLIKAREAGARIVAIDPRYTSSTAALADTWMPIRPGTDSAMLIAMAYVVIREGLQDQEFIDKYTVGFEQYKKYLMGEEDGTAKTPSWAEEITGVPAVTIAQLARDFASMKPAALIDGIAPGRSAYGEQYHRAAIVLAAITGNIGKRGCNAPGRSWVAVFGTYPYKLGPGLSYPNPVEKGAPPRKCTIPAYDRLAPGSNSSARVQRFLMADALLKGKAGGYPNDYKLAYIVGTNYVNQMPNTNKIVKALNNMEFIVVHEQFMTATARYADIVLPVTTYMEHYDLGLSTGTPAYMFSKKVVEPAGECKTHLEIFVELARRLGIKDYSDRTEEQYIKRMVESGGDIPDYETFRNESIYRVPLREPFVAFKAQIEDPVNHPFGTPSGKIEIFSQVLADMNDPHVPPIPKYIEPWEGPNDPLSKKYSLQLITTHMIRRAHSVFESAPWLKEIAPQAITINRSDAEFRGIKDGDLVRVFNDRGEIVMPVIVSERILTGVADMPEGGWYAPDANGVDRGGNPNVVSNDRPSPGGADPTNTCLVEVAKA